MDIPHSSKVVTGTRVPLLKRPDWHGSDLFWIAISPLLIGGAVTWWVIHFKEGHSFDSDTLGATACCVFLGLIAFAFGAGTLYLSFFGDHSVEAPCPVCGDPQPWKPGTIDTCTACLAAMCVDGDGTIREVSLDDASGFTVFPTVNLDHAITKDGHVHVEMPAICAVCGADPTTTGKVKIDDTITRDDDDDKSKATTAKELAALAVPLCAAHADKTPIELDTYTVDLHFDSYRYYRAFLLANAPRKAPPGNPAAVHAKHVQPPRATPGQLEPLTCDHCGAPLPVSDDDQTTCSACGHKAAVPEPYRELRDAKKLSDRDSAELQALAADIAAPPPHWKRVAMIVGYIVGGVTVVVVALGAIIGAVIGVLAGSQLGETITKWLAILCACVLGVASIPYVGEWIAAFATLHSMDAATALVGAASPIYRYDLIAAAILYGLGVVPLALAFRTQGNLDQIVALQGKLAAQPSPSADGAPCCRHCGAALAVAPDAIVSRCLYCGADNLLTVPASIAASYKKEASQLDASVQGAVAQHANERRDDRQTTLGLLLLGLLIVPYVCVAGYLLHKLVLG